MTTAPEPRDVLAVAMRYLRHRDGCAFHRQAECNCGLTDVIAAIREPAAALAAHPTPPPPPEYASCERQHAIGTTHYHPLRVKAAIDKWEDAHAPAATPSPDAGEPLRALSEIRAWAESGIAFAEEFQREHGSISPVTAGRTDAYRAIVGILDRAVSWSPESGT